MPAVHSLIRIPALTGVLALTLTMSASPALASAGSTTPKPVGHVGVVPLGDRALAEAVRHLGAPYVFGATGPGAFDCSGFTMYVFDKLGISLPRTSGAQYGSVRHVAQADRRVGDLIFFRLGGGGVDHVGIYAGNNQIVVAPKSGDHVRYEDIWTSSYSVGRVG